MKCKIIQQTKNKDGFEKPEQFKLACQSQSLFMQGLRFFLFKKQIKGFNLIYLKHLVMILIGD